MKIVQSESTPDNYTSTTVCSEHSQSDTFFLNLNLLKWKQDQTELKKAIAFLTKLLASYNFIDIVF